MLSPQQVHTNTLQFIQSTDGLAVVCFDFFDTLVTRSVLPEYTKRFAAKQLSRLLLEEISGDDLYDMRHGMEAAMCAENDATGLDLEFNLESLARKLYSELYSRKLSALHRFSEEEFAASLLNIEFAVETQVQTPCADMLSLLRELKEKEVQTILISDFYLPQSFFKKLLKYHQIDDLFDQIYISCECLLTKGSGRLYEKMVDELNLEKSSLLMIGDNPHADKDMAEKQGITSLLLDRQAFRDRYVSWVKEQEDETANARRLSKDLAAVAREHGGNCFPEMGLILWQFIHNLSMVLLNNKVRSVFFLSREGELLKKMFEQYQAVFWGQQHIACHYLLISRKSSYLTSLRSLEEEDFATLFFQYRDISARDFLLSLNISELKSREICRHAGVEYEQRQQNFPESETFSNILHCRMFSETYESLRQEQQENLIRYISSSSTTFKEEGLHIVDVGWKGSMQENLFRLFKGQVQVFGYYIGLLDSVLHHPSLQKNGLVFSEIPAETPYKQVYNNNRSLFEMVLGASHGSAEGYFSVKSDIHGRENASIHTRCQGTDDREVFVATVELPEERKLYLETIQPLQKKIFDTFSAVNGLMLCTLAGFPGPRWFARQHARMVFLPRRNEIDFFENLYHLENFGVFEFTTFKPGETISLQKKIYNLKAVLKDPALLEIGFWPPIILNHMGIGLYRYIDGIRRYYKAFGVRGMACMLPFL